MKVTAIYWWAIFRSKAALSKDEPVWDLSMKSGKNIAMLNASKFGRPIKTRLKKAVWPCLSKPWETPTMEFDYGLWLGLSALISQSGRQLGEENTWPAHLNLHLPAQTAVCNFEGSRAQKEINLSALGIAMKHFDEALLICRAVRHVHCQRRQNVHNDDLGIWDLYIISRSCLALIAFMKRSKALPEPMGNVLDVLTSVYQFVSGLFMIGRDMIDTANPAAVQNRHITAQELYNYADRKGIFLSPNGMVCAGSRRKIFEFLEVFDTDARENWTGDEFDLQTLVGNVEQWHNYTIATIDLEFFVLCERLGNDIARQPDDAAHLQKVLTIYYHANAYLLECYPQKIPTQERSSQEAARLRQNKILALLGRPGIARLNTVVVKKQFGLD